MALRSNLQKNDFNGDGLEDILWQNTSSGGVYLWTMSGFSIIGAGFLGATTQLSSWKVVTGGGDFNGDGRSDVLWQNTASGGVYLWTMNGFNVIGAGFVGATTQDLTWKVITSGDFNGDGRSDILWQNTSSGGVYLWTMNGFSIIGAGFVGATTQSSAWKVIMSGDINGDGNSDIIWQNTATGGVYAWEMGGNGFSIIGAGFLGATTQDATWKVVAMGDINGDGNSDVIWQNTSSGGVYAWTMNGFNITGAGFLGATTQLSSWKVIGTEDINGDNRSDIIWQNTSSGGVYAWEMSGFNIIGAGFLGATTQDSTWKVIAKS